MTNMEKKQGFITGRVEGKPVFHHKIGYTNIYSMVVRTERNSGIVDKIPCQLPYWMIANSTVAGKKVILKGQFRSWSKYEKEEKKKHLELYFYVSDLEFAEEDQRDENRLILDAYICSKPKYRKTPLGRDITDLMLLVHRKDGVSDCLPCICWNKEAKKADEYQVGDHIQCKGRIQSREYKKLEEGGKVVMKTAYEVSIYAIDHFGKQDLDDKEK